MFFPPPSPTTTSSFNPSPKPIRSPLPVLTSPPSPDRFKISNFGTAGRPFVDVADVAIDGLGEGTRRGEDEVELLPFKEAGG